MTMEAKRRHLLPIAATLFAIALAFGLCGYAQEARANDYTTGSTGALTAQSSSTSKVVRGTFATGSPVTKVFTMPKKGYVAFAVNVPHGVGVTAVHIDANDVRYVSGTIINGGLTAGGGKLTTGRFTFKPGTKIKVTLDTTALGSQPIPYKITMKIVKPARYETEPNNSKSKANRLSLKKVHSGNIIKKDTDWYSFKASKAGTYRFSGKVVLLNRSDVANLTMAVYQGSKTLATEGVIAGEGYRALASVKLKKGETAWVRITPGVLFPSATESYALKAVKVK